MNSLKRMKNSLVTLVILSSLVISLVSCQHTTRLKKIPKPPRPELKQVEVLECGVVWCLSEESLKNLLDNDTNMKQHIDLLRSAPFWE